MRPVGVSGEMDFIPLKRRGWCEMIQFKPYSFASVTVFSFKRKKYSRTDICRIACLQSGVVVALLQSARGKILNRVNYTANVHRSNMSAKVVIIVGETIIFVQKLADDRHKICI